MKVFEKGLINRNKKIILIAVLIMLLSALAGAGIASEKAKGHYNQISSRLSQHPTDTVGDNGVSAIDLFIHNFSVDLITILGGFLFSVLSVILVIFNGVSVGSLFGIDLPFATVTVLPHAIIEYFAGALALAIAFKITQLEIKVIKSRNLKGTLKEHETDLKDILAIFVVMVILLAIAAFIEAHIMPLIFEWYF